MRVSRVVTDLILDGSRSSFRLVIQIHGWGQQASLAMRFLLSVSTKNSV